MNTLARMTITFKNDNDIIVYALKKIISVARTNQYIILAQSIWLIAPMIGLQKQLFIHINNLQLRANQANMSISLIGVDNVLPGQLLRI